MLGIHTCRPHSHIHTCMPTSICPHGLSAHPHLPIHTYTPVHGELSTPEQHFLPRVAKADVVQLYCRFGQHTARQDAQRQLLVLILGGRIL